MISELADELQEAHNNHFNDDDYARFLAETQNVSPSGEPMFICIDCCKFVPVLAKSQAKVLDLCKDCYAIRFSLRIPVITPNRQTVLN